MLPIFGNILTKRTPTYILTFLYLLDSRMTVFGSAMDFGQWPHIPMRMYDKIDKYLWIYDVYEPICIGRHLGFGKYLDEFLTLPGKVGL